MNPKYSLLFSMALLVMLSSCNTDKITEKQVSKKTSINRTNNCDTNLSPKHKNKPWKLNDSIIYIERIDNYFKYQNIKNNRIHITNTKKKVLLKDLKYFARISGGFQVLNSANQIVYYNLELKELSKEPKPEILMYCGNVSGWKLTIEKEEAYYQIKKKEGFSGSFGDKWQSIDSIVSNGVKDIYFLNNTKDLSYDENIRSRETIIIEYEDCFGIRTQGKTFHFDTINTSSSSIKVGCKGLFGYFEITEIKYKRLNAFEYDLAAFELENGTKGYIDINGNEYYE